MANAGGIRTKYLAPVQTKVLTIPVRNRFNRGIATQYNVTELRNMGLQNRLKVLGPQYTTVQSANNFPLVG